MHPFEGILKLCNLRRVDDIAGNSHEMYDIVMSPPHSVLVIGIRNVDGVKALPRGFRPPLHLPSHLVVAKNTAVSTVSRNDF